MEGLTTVYLHGRLGALVGGEWHLAVSSPAEALRAIDVNVRGKLRQYLGGEGAQKHYQIALGREDNAIGPEELAERSGHTDIHVIPVIQGGNGVVKAVIGVALLAMLFFTPVGFLGLTALGAAGATTLTLGGMFVFSIGTALLLGGVTELLTPTPKAGGKQTEQAQSANFQGNAASAVQGTPIPLVYGRALVAPTPICISHGAYRSTVSTANNGYVGNVEIRELPGGGVEYVPIDRGDRVPVAY
jgi:predicted phage tail protein